MDNAIYEYQCKECGKHAEVKADEAIPNCCGIPMEKLPNCTLTETAEHATTGNKDEPCYDYRAGSNE